MTSVIKSPSIHIFCLRNVLSPLTRTRKPGLVMLAWKVEERERCGIRKRPVSRPQSTPRAPGPEPARLCRGWPATVPGSPRKRSLDPTVNPIRLSSLTTCPRSEVPAAGGTARSVSAPGEDQGTPKGPPSPVTQFWKEAEGGGGPSHSKATAPQHPPPPGPPAPLPARGPPDNLTPCLEPPRAPWTTTRDPTCCRPPASHPCLSCSSPQSCRGFPGLIAHSLSSLRENELQEGQTHCVHGGILHIQDRGPQRSSASLCLEDSFSTTQLSR